MDGKSWLRAEWDRVAGYTLIALGALFLVLGYTGVSESPYVAEGLSYIMSGGIGGLFCLGAGATLLLSADSHDEWRKLDRVEAAILAGGEYPAPIAAKAAPAVEEPAAPERSASPATAAGGTA